MLYMTDTIGDRIRLLRGSMTQPAFGKIARTSKQHVGRIEKGAIEAPSPVLLERWAAHFGVRLEWIATGKEPKEAAAAAPSQPAIPDPDRLGVALTSTEKVIGELGLAMEKQLGKFAPVLAFAYGLTLSEFPHALPTRETAEGAKSLKDFDKKVISYLEKGVKDGTLGPFEPVVAGGAGSPRPSKAKGKKAGSRRT